MQTPLASSEDIAAAIAEIRALYALDDARELRESGKRPADILKALAVLAAEIRALHHTVASFMYHSTGVEP